VSRAHTDDDLIQEVIYHTRKTTSVPVQVKPDVKLDDSEAAAHLDTLASAIPSEDEAKADIAALVASLHTLTSLVLTSSTFRLILSDVLITAREFVADALENVAQTAAAVEVVAEKVEAEVRPGVEAENVQKPVHRHPAHEEKESVSVKEAMLNRIESVSLYGYIVQDVHI
jgi:hypothetical protein